MKFKWPPNYVEQAIEQTRWNARMKELEEEKKQEKLKELADRLKSINEMKLIILRGCSNDDELRGQAKYIAILDEVAGEAICEEVRTKMGPILRI